jgi:ComF family protein
MLDALYPSLCACCPTQGEGELCLACREHVAMRPLPEAIEGIAGGFVMASYRSPIGHSIASAKRRGERRAVQVIGRALGQNAHDLIAGDWFRAIVPVPSPWTRRIRRGFAPGHVLAEQVARACRLPLWSVLSVGHGARQSTLTADERRTNLALRLRCRPMPAGRVLLVDDVVTTGSTVSHCAQRLLHHGASEVWVLGACASLKQEKTADDPFRTFDATF